MRHDDMMMLEYKINEFFVCFRCHESLPPTRLILYVIKFLFLLDHHELQLQPIVSKLTTVNGSVLGQQTIVTMKKKPPVYMNEEIVFILRMQRSETYSAASSTGFIR